MHWIRADGGELAAGTEVEMEHAGTIRWMAEQLGSKPDESFVREVASRIAQDHVTELPDYYTRLKKMEGEAHV